MSAEMRVRVEQSEEAEKKLNHARQKYLPVSNLPLQLNFLYLKRVQCCLGTRQKFLSVFNVFFSQVATRGAVLYFVLADLAGVDFMYQFSLTWFQSMFVSCINTSSQPVQARRRQSSIAHIPSTIRRSSQASVESLGSQEEDGKKDQSK